MSFPERVAGNQIIYGSKPTLTTVNEAMSAIPSAGPRVVQTDAGTSSGVPTTLMPQGQLTPAQATYPAGTVHWANVATKTYYVAIPKAGLQGPFGQTHTLSTTSEDPSPKGSVATTLTDIEAKTGQLIYYPTGTVHWFDKTKNIYYLAIPKESGERLSGYGLGQTHTLQVTQVDPAPRGSMLTTKEDVEGKTGEKLTPFYKQTWFWLAVAAGIVVIGGAIWYIRSKKE